MQSADCRLQNGMRVGLRPDCARFARNSSGEAGSLFNSALCTLHSAFCILPSSPPVL